MTVIVHGLRGLPAPDLGVRVAPTAPARGRRTHHEPITIDIDEEGVSAESVDTWGPMMRGCGAGECPTY